LNIEAWALPLIFFNEHRLSESSRRGAVFCIETSILIYEDFDRNSDLKLPLQIIPVLGKPSISHLGIKLRIHITMHNKDEPHYSHYIVWIDY
jgi:hypothetical protein